MNKKKYTKPAMRVVKLQHQHIICSSPNGYDRQSVSIQSGEIDDEAEVW